MGEISKVTADLRFSANPFSGGIRFSGDTPAGRASEDRPTTDAWGDRWGDHVTSRLWSSSSSSDPGRTYQNPTGEVDSILDDREDSEWLAEDAEESDSDPTDVDRRLRRRREEETSLSQMLTSAITAAAHSSHSSSSSSCSNSTSELLSEPDDWTAGGTASDSSCSASMRGMLLSLGEASSFFFFLSPENDEKLALEADLNMNWSVLGLGLLLSATLLKDVDGLPVLARGVALLADANCSAREAAAAE